MPVLLVEDDRRQSVFLVHILREFGGVLACRTGEEALEAIADRPFSLALIDWNLPGMDGLSVCRELRQQQPSVPALILTVRNTEVEKVRALDAGADDIVTKPYGVAELRARLRRLLRSDVSGVRTVGAITIDHARRHVEVAGNAVHFTRHEYDLLHYLASRADTAVERVDLLGDVWGLNVDPGSNVVDKHVSALRKKLGPAACGQIETLRGVGYILHGTSARSRSA